MRIVRKGRWLYDGAVYRPVDIVALDRDWWYELAAADGTVEPGESPAPMGDSGFLYYVRFRRAGERRRSTWMDSPGHRTVEAAIADAEARVPSPIEWS